MRTVDRQRFEAPFATVWRLAAEVERWPERLAHYRDVRRVQGAPGADGVVEMAAWRPFGPLRWPTWWRSEMQLDEARGEIRYRHVAGITRGMAVCWRIEPQDEGWCDVTIVHEWDGPPWPGLRRLAAEGVIGPVFVHGIASRTLAGLARHAGMPA